MRKPKSPSKPVTPTALNIDTLREHMRGGSRCSARVPQTDHPHLRRCILGGLARVDGGELVLTDAGRAAIGGAS